MTNQHERTERALNILAKWRSHFTSWQLGTRSKGDPEGDALRDHREATILLRAEVTALVAVLCDKGIIELDEFLVALEKEAQELCAAYERRWPGVTATETGLTYDKRIVPWMKGWRL